MTLKDQSILANGDINEGEHHQYVFYSFFLPFLFPPSYWHNIKLYAPDVDMLENVEIGEQKQRDEAYKAAKRKKGIYEDK